MIVVNVFAGFVSEIRAYFLGARLANEHQDELILDLSQFYNGSYWFYHLDYLKIKSIKKIAYRNVEHGIEILSSMLQRDVVVVNDGDDLIKVHYNFDRNKIYYIKNDSYFYDEFFIENPKYYFRYIGHDEYTKRLFQDIELRIFSKEYKEFIRRINNVHGSVGVHVRLGDFYNVGWIVEDDFAFFRAAIQWFRENLAESHFFVFSDDIVAAKKILGCAEDIEYVKFKFSQLSDLEEFFSLAQCEYRILDKKSTYGLFSETVAQNKYDKDNITLIIKNRHFQDNAGNKEYVEKAVNTDNGPNKNQYFGKHIELDEYDIRSYEIKYEFKSYYNDEKSVETNKMPENGCLRTNNAILFVTMQKYSKGLLQGMQYFAHYLSKKGYCVAFVGGDYDFENGEAVDLEKVFDKSITEHGMNKMNSRVTVFSYKLLNRYNKYSDFYKEYNKRNHVSGSIVIIRKPMALPPIANHGDNTFVFIDFSDPYEKEAIKYRETYTQSELEWMYDNADIIVTYSEEVKKKWGKEKTVLIIDLESIYPQTVILNDNDNPTYTQDRIDELCESIIKKITNALA